MVAAVAFVAIFGVEGFAYTIILYFILSAMQLKRREKQRVPHRK